MHQEAKEAGRGRRERAASWGSRECSPSAEPALRGTHRVGHSHPQPGPWWGLCSPALSREVRYKVVPEAQARRGVPDVTHSASNPGVPVNTKYTAAILHSHRTPRPWRGLFAWMLLARGAPDTRLARSRVHFRHYQSN